MLKIFTDVFQELHGSDVTFCNWKGHHDIQSHLQGNGDLDIFVPLHHKFKFEMIIGGKGFRRVNSYQASHDFVEHYYGLDMSTGRFGHLHVYYKIVTGESISKNYILPIDKFIKDHLDDARVLPIVNERAKAAIFLIRYFIKIGSPYGWLQYWRESSKYSNEWGLIDFQGQYESIPELKLSVDDLSNLSRAYTSGGIASKFITSIKFKNKIRHLRRRSLLGVQVYVLKNFFIRLTNRVFLKKKKLLSPGLVVAICGLDGTGKSSLVESLSTRFSEHFCMKSLHLGRPSSTKVSLIFKPLLALRVQIKRLKKAEINSSKIESTAKESGIIYAIRSVLLAYDRKAESLHAHSLSSKGYLVICDRYPGLLAGKMDSPRIPLDIDRGRVYQYCYRVEQYLYHTIRPANMLFHLQAPVEVAIERNNAREKAGKETEKELRERFLINSDATFISDNYRYVDATAPLQNVFSEVTNGIWFEWV
jgi:thymidylate kinase